MFGKKLNDSSPEFGERFTELRDFLGMSRKQFGDEIGVSARTIEGIENAGNVPRSDVISKVAERWPEFSLWLLTGSHIPKKTQRSPLGSSTNILNIIDKVDPRHLQFSLINKEFLVNGKVIFVQNLDFDYSLGVLLKLEEKQLQMFASAKMRNAMVWLESGFLNFSSNDTGRNNLRNLRELLSELNGDLINNAEIYGLEDSKFKILQDSLEVFSSDFNELPSNSEALSRLKEWKEGGDYLWPHKT